MIHSLRNGTLKLIELRPEIPGFKKFIGSWVWTEEKEKFLVDVGPSSTVPLLLESLKKLKINKLDYVFLTHIHIDHAGGLGEFVKHFPETKIFCYEKAVKHLLKPSKLWEASKKVLGDLAIKYGEILPVPKENFIKREEIEIEGFKVINTPGHSSHHVSFLYKNYLFVGEAAGVFQSLNNEFYLRPVTPPKFFFETYLNSLEKLLNLVSTEKICYGHFGIYVNAKKMLRTHKKQLLLWGKVIKEEIETATETNSEDVIDKCLRILLEKDQLLKLDKLEKDIQQREKEFLRNSIKGYLRYFKQRKRLTNL